MCQTGKHAPRPVRVRSRGHPRRLLVKVVFRRQDPSRLMSTDEDPNVRRQGQSGQSCDEGHQTSFFQTRGRGHDSKTVGGRAGAVVRWATSDEGDVQPADSGQLHNSRSMHTKGADLESCCVCFISFLKIGRGVGEGWAYFQLRRNRRIFLTLFISLLGKRSIIH